MDTRLDWHTGMELTPATFIESDNMEYQYKVLLRKIMASNAYGLIPDMKKEIDWFVDNDTIMINSLKFNALTRSGEILSVDMQQTHLTIPSYQTPDEFYVTVELTTDTEKIIHNEVEKVRQKTVLSLKSLSELNERKSYGAVPFGKIRLKFEQYIKDEQYVPPIITIESSPDLRELIDQINFNITNVLAHKNFLRNGNGDDLTIAVLYEKLRCFNANNTPESYADKCSSFIIVMSMSVFKERIQMIPFEPNDIMKWFNWFIRLTDNCLQKLDSMTIEEPVVEEEKKEDVVDEFIPIL